MPLNFQNWNCYHLFENNTENCRGIQASCNKPQLLQSVKRWLWRWQWLS